MSSKKNDARAVLMGYLKELRLPTFSESFEELSRKAVQESLSYERYLFELVERECEERRRKRVERYLRESRLPLEKNFDSFNLKRLPKRVRQQVATLLEDTFLDRKENILAFGNPGSGKTHLVYAIAQELIRRDVRRIYSSTCSVLVQELLIAKRDLRLPKLLNRLGRFDAIVIDDIGYVQQNRDEMEVLFTLLAESYERTSIILTSNLVFSKWEKIFKDPMTTAAAIDRLVHHSIILELNIPSYRAEEAEKKTKNGQGDK
jgi:DNA replication protein DnaC